MTESGYFDYSGQDPNTFLPPMNPYRDGSDAQDYGSNGKSQLAGFYSNHYPGSQDNPANPSSQASMPNSPDMSVSTGYQHMFPSVPTGNPDDPKDMGAAAASLAKPVPMRRLSEKRIAQARAHLMGPMADYLLDPSYGDLQAATSPAVAHALAATQQTQKRPRSEKKAIPDEAKDDKYFERRKRNNCAAKKSRDARKAREDEIAIRASFLEKENAILRAQVATLREEANSLRQLLLQKRSRP